MNISASVEFKAVISELGITVGETTITWGLILDHPGARAKILEQLCGTCPSPADVVPVARDPWANRLTVKS